MPIPKVISTKIKVLFQWDQGHTAYLCESNPLKLNPGEYDICDPECRELHVSFFEGLPEQYIDLIKYNEFGQKLVDIVFPCVYTQSGKMVYPLTI